MKKRSWAPFGADANLGLQLAEAGAGDEAVVLIDGIGARGDGLASFGGARAHIPFALPGERARVRIQGRRASLLEIETPSPDRIAPVCRHFGACGGCALQHWNEASYAAWKRSLVASALARAGIEAEVEPLKQYAGASRRRAAFAAVRTKTGVQLGFSAVRSHEIVNLEECPVLLPQIAAALPSLREALTALLPAGSEARVHITAAVNGLDCAIESEGAPKSAAAAAFEAFAAAGIVRALWNGEIVFFRVAPAVRFGGVQVALPPAAFLQAVEACERDMASFALEALEGSGALKGPVCDLFAGLGAFTFPVATRAPVTAYEMAPQAAGAIEAAARAARGLKPVTAVRRDLYRNPLSAMEINKFAAVLLDPPREGAEAQAKALAASKVETIVALSCNPVTFARDAAHLIGGGFRLSRVAAFDQFKYSAHVELAAAFQRSVSRRTKRGGR